MVLAILAHCVLLAILSVGVQWKNEPLEQSFEAELWASVPVEAAPPAPALEPEPPKPPKPLPPEVKPKPEPKPAPPPPTAAALKAEADIALSKEREKQRKEKKLAQEKLELEKKKLAELEKQKLAELEKKKQAELDKQAKLEQANKADKLKLEQANARDKLDKQRKLDAKETQQIDAQRKDAVKRAMGFAGAGGNGAPGSTSTALEAKSLSQSYVGRIRSYIKRFHTYTDTVSGNPTTEIEVRLSSDGSILSRRITKASGTKSWDDAALNAIDKAEKLPLDENGRAPSPMVIIWSAQELGR